MADVAGLNKSHIEYWKTHVKSPVLPETFAQDFDPAALGYQDEQQQIIRIEALERPLQLKGISFDQLNNFLLGNDTASIAEFLKKWDERRDYRPCFAAFLGDLQKDVDAPDWANLLRDRLGLAHYDAATGPIPVALMQYSVKDVLAEKPDNAVAMTFPTPLDSEPWPYFYPAPKSLTFGRAMALNTDGDYDSLQSEILHTTITYKPNHLVKIGYITNPVPNISLRDLRNHHLDCLHIQAGDDSFGEKMA